VKQQPNMVEAKTTLLLTGEIYTCSVFCLFS